MKLEKFRQKVKQKADALSHIIISIQPYYFSATPKNRRFIETTVGAAIWYLPKSKEILFTGMISQEALKSGERSEEHLYPRKIAAEELLQTQWQKIEDPPEYLADAFIAKYGRYNYVSKAENRKLIQYQKSNIFTDPKKAYAAAGVILVPHP